MAGRLADDLFREHHLAVFRFLCARTRDRNLAEDLTQEVFIRVVRGADQFDQRGTDRAWLLTIARRLLFDHQRSRSRKPTLVDDYELETHPSPTPGPRELDLEQALSGLPDLNREAFLLRELGGLGYEEIGTLLDLAPGAVRNRIFRARLALRAALLEEVK